MRDRIRDGGIALAVLIAARVPAEKASQWGLVYKVVNDEELMSRSEFIAAPLARGPTLAYSLIRHGSRRAMEQTLTETLALEPQGQLVSGRSIDFREGIAANREKREPGFQGR